MSVCICKRNGRRNPHCEAHGGFRNRMQTVRAKKTIIRKSGTNLVVAEGDGFCLTNEIEHAKRFASKPSALKYLKQTNLYHIFHYWVSRID